MNKIFRCDLDTGLKAIAGMIGGSIIVLVAWRIIGIVPKLYQNAKESDDIVDSFILYALIGVVVLFCYWFVLAGGFSCLWLGKFCVWPPAYAWPFFM